MKPLLMVLLMVVPASARPHPKPVRAPRDVTSLTRMARHYVQTEQRIAGSADAISTNELVAHWNELHVLRVGLVQLDRRGQLKHLSPGRRVVLRHLLAELLGQITDIALDPDDVRLTHAHDVRNQDLSAVSSVARRTFDIAIADANGVWQPG
jgi:hypothetical protein